jgi:hypothetical protein
MYAFLLMFFITTFFGPEGPSTFLYAVLSNYVGHFILHDDLFWYSPYSVLHRYHHVNHSPFAYVVNILSECSMLTIILLSNVVGCTFNPWSILFNMLIYVSVHYINCSWFHVNRYHEKHHAQIDTNMSPDVLDAFFGTKHKDSPLHEDTTHMIPNVLVAAILVLWLKRNYRESWNRIFGYSSIAIVVILSIISSRIK